MFSTHPLAIVPELVLGSDSLLEAGVDNWFDQVKSASFDSEGKPIPFGPKGSILIANLSKLESIRDNAKLRFKACR